MKETVRGLCPRKHPVKKLYLGIYMTELRKYKKQIAMWAMLCLTLAAMLFIFSNSTKDAPTSSQQSDKVVDAVRPPAEIILPIINVEPSDSNIVSIVRKSAHFLEFALLGCLAFWTVRLWTRKKLLCLALPFGFSAVTALIDETIQLTSPGRAWQLQDIFVDVAGASSGMLFAFICVLFCMLVKKRRKKL